MRTRGFTLVEMIVVMVVIGIIGVLAAPKLLSSESTDVPGHADKLRALLRFAQKTAIAQNRPVYIDVTSARVTACFDDGCSVIVKGPDGANSGSSATTTACSSSTWACEGAPTGVSHTFTRAEFSFDAQGRPFADGDTVTSDTSTFALSTITVTGGGITNVVTIEADTGYVH